MKQLFIVKDHHHVLIPWAKVRQTNGKLNLITFDHHTDVHEAFLHHLYYHKHEDLDSLIVRIDFRNERTIIDAIKNLRNDEHIDTAIRCGIINKAFSIAYDGSFDKPESNERTAAFKNEETKLLIMLGQIPVPEAKTYPDSKIYVVGTSEYLDDENCISDEFLLPILSKMKIMNKADVMEDEYILDIDLDYFHSYKALERSDIDLFRSFLRRATAITIATEPDFAFEGIKPEDILKKIISISTDVIEDDLEIVDLRP